MLKVLDSQRENSHKGANNKWQYYNFQFDLLIIFQPPFHTSPHSVNIKRQMSSCLKCPNTFKGSFKLYRHSIKKIQRKTIWMCIQVQPNKKILAKIALSSLAA